MDRYIMEEKEMKYGEEVTTQVFNSFKLTKDCVIGFVLLILAWNCFTIVPAGHGKTQQLFGKVYESPLVEGFHLVNPLTSFTEYDLRNQTYNISDIMVPSQDKLKSDMDVSVIYRFDVGSIVEIKKTVGTAANFDAKYLVPKVRSLIREVGKGVGRSQDFFLDDVQQDMQTRSLDALNTFFQPKGVHVEAVLFRDITLPPMVLRAIQETKARQEEINRETAQLQIVEQQALAQVKEAEAKELAAVSLANAVRTHADAEAYKIKVEAYEQSIANKLLSASITPVLVRYNSVSKWNGSYPQTMMTGSNDIMLALPNNK